MARRRKLRKPVIICSVESCGREVYATGHCKRHYMQILRHGKLTPEREHGRAAPCGSSSCQQKACVRGYCRKHARQIDLYGRLTPEREYMLGVKHCTEANCSEPVRAKGLCARHYNQQWREHEGQDTTA